jgi:hypothetical protein
MALRITIPYPPALTDRVLCAALESTYGAHYWLRDYSHRMQYAAGGNTYVALHIGAHSEGTFCVKHSRIGASRIAAALELMLQSGPLHVKCAARVLANEFDAPDADVVLQFAAFGEVIYG